MSSNSRSNSTSAMRQIKLDFPSSKRTSSASGAKKVVVNPAKRAVVQVSSSEETRKAAEINSTALKDEEEELEKISIAPPEEQTLQGSTRKKPIPEELPELNIRDPRWRKLFTDAKAKRGGLPLVHGKDENNVHQILRVFDLNYDYGPCIGVTRLERWERANVLGLNPPIEIRDILRTREGTEQKSYLECVFYDEV